MGGADSVKVPLVFTATFRGNSASAVLGPKIGGRVAEHPASRTLHACNLANLMQVLTEHGKFDCVRVVSRLLQLGIQPEQADSFRCYLLVPLLLLALDRSSGLRSSF